VLVDCRAGRAYRCWEASHSSKVVGAISASAAGSSASPAGGIDPAPIVAAVNAVGDDVQTQLADLHRQLAEAQSENERLRQQLAAAPQFEPPTDNNGRGDAEGAEADEEDTPPAG
jgi:hypothetical protein